MRVARTGSRREGSVTQSKSKRKSVQIERTFSETLQIEQVEQFNIVEALEEIDDYARRFKESPVLENLLKYKRKVRAILQFLVQASYEVTETAFYDPQGRRRLLTLVENVDHKLEELTRDFLNKQTNGLDLVSRLDEIRGLLLDLYL